MSYEVNEILNQVLLDLYPKVDNLPHYWLNIAASAVVIVLFICIAYYFFNKMYEACGLKKWKKATALAFLYFLACTIWGNWCVYGYDYVKRNEEHKLDTRIRMLVEDKDALRAVQNLRESVEYVNLHTAKKD